MSNLPKWILLDARSSTTRNDSAKFDDFNVVIHGLSNLVRKHLTFTTKFPQLCLVCNKNVKPDRKVETLARELTNGAARRRSR